MTNRLVYIPHPLSDMKWMIDTVQGERDKLCDPSWVAWMYVWMDAHMYNWSSLPDQPVNPSVHREYANLTDMACCSSVPCLPQLSLHTLPTRLTVERPTKCLQTRSNPRTNFASLIWVCCMRVGSVTHAYARSR